MDGISTGIGIEMNIWYQDFGGYAEFCKLKDTNLYKLAGSDPYERRIFIESGLLVSSVDIHNKIVTLERF